MESTQAVFVPSWTDVSAALKVGDAIPYWSSYQTSDGTFIVRELESDRVLISIPGTEKPVVIFQKHFEILAPHYLSYAGRLQTPEEYREVKRQTRVQSYVYAIFRWLSESKPLKLEGALSVEIARVFSGMKSREHASGTVRQSVAPARSVQVTIEDLHELWREAEGLCALCGGPIELVTANPLLQMSPDRVDNNDGAYTRSNTQLTHVGCNLGRNAATPQEFREWLSCIRG